jgi:S1-C subfamily serine protease
MDNLDPAPPATRSSVPTESSTEPGDSGTSPALNHAITEKPAAVHLMRDQPLGPLPGSDEGIRFPPPAPLTAPAHSARSPFSFFVSLSAFLAVLLLALYVAPYLWMHWRVADAQAEAEATYQKRRAELKADAEAADQRLQALDDKVKLVSLGFREVVKKVAPNVVNVANLREPRKADEPGFGKRGIFHDPDTDRKYFQLGVGSGIIVKPGYILTNHHVVKGADRLRITFASGQAVGEDVEAVTSDPLTDLAVIKMSSTVPAGVRADLNHAAAFADSDKDVQVGDWALAVGSPLGLRQTVTQGVISAKGRLLSMLDLVELLQTDAAINPGNSGGPLFDQHGRVVGINVAIASDNGLNQGIGFAIPSNLARKIFDDLVKKGEVTRGYIGVALEDLSTKQHRELKLGDAGGVRIAQVQPDRAAAKAGLQAGDVIVAYRNQPLERLEPMRQLRHWILDTEPESKVAVDVLRNGQRRQLELHMGKRPAQLP